LFFRLRDAVGDNGKTALQPWCEIAPLGCRLPYHDSRIDGVSEINEEMQRRANRCGRLSHMIGQFKSAVTKYAHEKDISFIWQPRYHDHIIRNQLEMNRIADYIQNNPMNWELDRFYKKK
jgi:REP element-mobilizing transposase RayT